MLEKSSTSYLGPGCREFESRHSDQKMQEWLLPSLHFYCLIGARLEDLNATRTSVAGEGLTEPILNLRPLAQMQTSLATRVKSSSLLQFIML